MKPPTLAAVYLGLYPVLVEVAREHGYALAAHGTISRDLDLVAIPWIDAACQPNELVGALGDRIKFTTHPFDGARGPVTKPHGRLGWTIGLDNGAFIDLSVMPMRAGAPIAPVAPKPEDTP